MLTYNLLYKIEQLKFLLDFTSDYKLSSKSSDQADKILDDLESMYNMGGEL